MEFSFGARDLLEVFSCKSILIENTCVLMSDLSFYFCRLIYLFSSLYFHGLRNLGGGGGVEGVALMPYHLDPQH